VFSGGFQDKVTEFSDFPTTVTVGASDAEIILGLLIMAYHNTGFILFLNK